MPRLRQLTSRTQAKMDRSAADAELDPRDIPGFGMERVIGKRIKPQPNGCWYWDGSRTERGRITWNHKSWVPYRLVYCMFNKLPHLPRGWHIHHHCQNPGCVNPEHLSLLTPLQHLEAHDLLRLKCSGTNRRDCAKDAVANGRCKSCDLAVKAERSRHAYRQRKVS